MQTEFSLAQLADPEVANSNEILRRCTHCGFCTATCPTFVLLGDELDSPRGRIYLMKKMLEGGAAPDDRTVLHIDRCLSCLSCMTTCPATVHYMHLVDHGRKYIEENYTRPWPDRALRWLLKEVLPYPSRFRAALAGATLARPFTRLFPGRLKTLVGMAPRALPSPSWVDRPQVIPAEGPRKARVAMLNGCAQQVIDPDINEATVRLLTRHGVEVVVAKGAGCCGALVHHMGKEPEAHVQAKANIAAWVREMDGEGLDAVIINTSGCGTTVKDYGYMLRLDDEWKDAAQRVSALAKDVSEFMADFGLMPPVRGSDMRVTYHSACSMQHGQGITRQPKQLLADAGFTVADVPEGHICCGSAGTYNLLQPEIANQLRERKVENIARTRPDVIATGNVGCITQIAAGTDVPILHTAELLDWATGGPLPKALEGADIKERPPRPATAEAAE
ncbi:glycolate oxidase subunit GlcF [Ferruginivarius sediminum]|uniref:Glycolate oxidase iron-sulfur subunit n=1 Tax=Ferruginivarius sediminum TaxID=2661937 RepID=A0A369TF25_9PROT|nr:glycolate oxidase subunit GlcF [Ferruginivarius sediminum]RDD63432.1 glycolate oxidase iron-sulfur subunit [Ferruginivarius sediminum]